LVGLVTILSPTRPVRQYGQGTVRGLFKGFAAEQLKGFAAWLPMMLGGNVQFADQAAESSIEVLK